MEVERHENLVLVRFGQHPCYSRAEPEGSDETFTPAVASVLTGEIEIFDPPMAKEPGADSEQPAWKVTLPPLDQVDEDPSELADVDRIIVSPNPGGE
jgi:hypothetical protein